MSTDQPVNDLVTRARNGDKHTWDALVERYAPLIWSICRRHQLADADARDIGQNVWLRLVDHLGTSATRPRCPAGWPPPPGGCGRCCALPGDRRLRVRTGRGALPDEQAITAEQQLLTPNATRRCARRSWIFPQEASG